MEIGALAIRTDFKAEEKRSASQSTALFHERAACFHFVNGNTFRNYPWLVSSRVTKNCLKRIICHMLKLLMTCVSALCYMTLYINHLGSKGQGAGVLFTKHL